MESVRVSTCARVIRRAFTSDIDVRRVLASTLMLFAAHTSVAPRTAEACSCFVQTVLVHPQPGGQDVPVDTVLRIAGDLDGADITLEREDGTPVDVTQRELGSASWCSPMLVELRPNAMLEPRTRYRLRVEPARGDDLVQSFETGTSRVPEMPLDTPTVRASFASQTPDTCGVTGAGCVVLSGAAQYEVILVEGDTERATFTSASELRLSLLYSDAPDCVRVRARDDAGRYSDPVEICGDALRANSATPQCDADAFFTSVDSAGESVHPKAAGCHVAGVGSTTRAIPYTLLLASIFLGARRTRRRSGGRRQAAT